MFKSKKEKRKMPKALIVISGSPGVGKSTLAKKLVKELKFSRLDLSKHYKEISVNYNQEKQCYDVDLKKMISLVKKKIGETKNGLIIDSHISHLLPKKIVNLCIVTTCSNLKKLESRLKKRGYSKQKIRENLDAEIFQVCLNESREKGHEVIVFDEKDNINLKKLIKTIKGRSKS